MNEDKPCKIIEDPVDVGICKLKCETHNQSALHVYTYRGEVGIRCQVGEANHSGTDYETSLCVDLRVYCLTKKGIKLKRTIK
jgi:hypothetical protein